ncbi:ABC transporter permease, partial [Hymenobacter profundi]
MESKFWLVAQREYLTRVRKKSFLVLTLLVPVLFAGFGFLIAKVAMADNDDIDVVRVLDQSPAQLAARLKSTERMQFIPVQGPLEQAKSEYRKSDDGGLLYLPATITPEQNTGIQLYAKGNVSLRKQKAVEDALDKILAEEKLRGAGISQEKLDALRSSVDVASINLDEAGKEKSSNALATSGISYALALLIYMFIFIYGVQVMRGVGEEKSSRIMEVMLSSVKPFQLMMGKIVGIAAVGLTQFLLWGVLSWGVSVAVGALVLDKLEPAKTEVAATSAQTTTSGTASAATPAAAQSDNDPTAIQQAATTDRLGIFKVLGDLPIGTILFGFVAYFLGGYLLYGALFGAIGAAVDDQTDTQQ